MTRSSSQLVEPLDGKPLLVVHGNDELADEPEVLQGITSEAMVSVPEVEEPKGK